MQLVFKDSDKNYLAHYVNEVKPQSISSVFDTYDNNSGYKTIAFAVNGDETALYQVDVVSDVEIPAESVRLYIWKSTDRAFAEVGDDDYDSAIETEELNGYAYKELTFEKKSRNSFTLLAPVSVDYVVLGVFSEFAEVSLYRIPVAEGRRFKKPTKKFRIIDGSNIGDVTISLIPEIKATFNEYKEPTSVLSNDMDLILAVHRGYAFSQIDFRFDSPADKPKLYLVPNSLVSSFNSLNNTAKNALKLAIECFSTSSLIIRMGALKYANDEVISAGAYSLILESSFGVSLPFPISVSSTSIAARNPFWLDTNKLGTLLNAPNHPTAPNAQVDWVKVHNDLGLLPVNTNAPVGFWSSVIIPISVGSAFSIKLEYSVVNNFGPIMQLYNGSLNNPSAVIIQDSSPTLINMSNFAMSSEYGYADPSGILVLNFETTDKTRIRLYSNDRLIGSVEAPPIANITAIMLNVSGGKHYKNLVVRNYITSVTERVKPLYSTDFKRDWESSFVNWHEDSIELMDVAGNALTSLGGTYKLEELGKLADGEGVSGVRKTQVNFIPNNKFCIAVTMKPRVVDYNEWGGVLFATYGPVSYIGLLNYNKRGVAEDTQYSIHFICKDNTSSKVSFAGTVLTSDEINTLRTSIQRVAFYANKATNTLEIYINGVLKSVRYTDNQVSKNDDMSTMSFTTMGLNEVCFGDFWNYETRQLSRNFSGNSELSKSRRFSGYLYNADFYADWNTTVATADMTRFVNYEIDVKANQVVKFNQLSIPVVKYESSIPLIGANPLSQYIDPTNPYRDSKLWKARYIVENRSNKLVCFDTEVNRFKILCEDANSASIEHGVRFNIDQYGKLWWIEITNNPSYAGPHPRPEAQWGSPYTTRLRTDMICWTLDDYDATPRKYFHKVFDHLADNYYDLLTGNYLFSEVSRGGGEDWIDSSFTNGYYSYISNTHASNGYGQRSLKTINRGGNEYNSDTNIRAKSLLNQIPKIYYYMDANPVILFAETNEYSNAKLEHYVAQYPTSWSPYSDNGFQAKGTDGRLLRQLANYQLFSGSPNQVGAPAPYAISSLSATDTSIDGTSVSDYSIPASNNAEYYMCQAGANYHKQYLPYRNFNVLGVSQNLLNSYSTERPYEVIGSLATTLGPRVLHSDNSVLTNLFVDASSSGGLNSVNPNLVQVNGMCLDIKTRLSIPGCTKVAGIGYLQQIMNTPTNGNIVYAELMQEWAGHSGYMSNGSEYKAILTSGYKWMYNPSVDAGVMEWGNGSDAVSGNLNGGVTPCFDRRINYLVMQSEYSRGSSGDGMLGLGSRNLTKYAQLDRVIGLSWMLGAIDNNHTPYLIRNETDDSVNWRQVVYCIKADNKGNRSLHKISELPLDSISYNSMSLDNKKKLNHGKLHLARSGIFYTTALGTLVKLEGQSVVIDGNSTSGFYKEESSVVKYSKTLVVDNKKVRVNYSPSMVRPSFNTEKGIPIAGANANSIGDNSALIAYSDITESSFVGIRMLISEMATQISNYRTSPIQAKSLFQLVNVACVNETGKKFVLSIGVTLNPTPMLEVSLYPSIVNDRFIIFSHPASLGPTYYYPILKKIVEIPIPLCSPSTINDLDLYVECDLRNYTNASLINTGNPLQVPIINIYMNGGYLKDQRWAITAGWEVDPNGDESFNGGTTHHGRNHQRDLDFTWFLPGYSGTNRLYPAIYRTNDSVNGNFSLPYKFTKIAHRCSELVVYTDKGYANRKGERRPKLVSMASVESSKFVPWCGENRIVNGEWAKYMNTSYFQGYSVERTASGIICRKGAEIVTLPESAQDVTFPNEYIATDDADNAVNLNRRWKQVLLLNARSIPYFCTETNLYTAFLHNDLGKFVVRKYSSLNPIAYEDVVYNLVDIILENADINSDGSRIQNWKLLSDPDTNLFGFVSNRRDVRLIDCIAVKDNRIFISTGNYICDLSTMKVIASSYVGNCMTSSAIAIPYSGTFDSSTIIYSTDDFRHMWIDGNELMLSYVRANSNTASYMFRWNLTNNQFIGYKKMPITQSEVFR